MENRALRTVKVEVKKLCCINVGYRQIQSRPLPPNGKINKNAQKLIFFNLGVLVNSTAPTQYATLIMV